MWNVKNDDDNDNDNDNDNNNNNNHNILTKFDILLIFPIASFQLSRIPEARNRNRNRNRGGGRLSYFQVRLAT